MTERVDVLISGGTVVDGSGAAGFAGSVAISGDRLTVLRAGAEAPPAERVIDAAGKVVAPGFIDLHSTSASPERTTRKRLRPARAPPLAAASPLSVACLTPSL